MRILGLCIALTLLSVTAGAVPRAQPGPAEFFSRAQAVLGHFGAQEQIDPEELVRSLHRQQTQNAFQALLPILDPSGTFQRFAWIENDILHVTQDADAKRTEDFSVEFATELPAPSRGKVLNPALPLAGLRIALDPGHMGGEFWDELSGKRITGPDGTRVSEGVLNLQIALLLERELLALGAEVLLTHRSLSPATDTAYRSFDFIPLAQRELRDRALQSWFRSLLAAFAPGPDLYAAFANHTNVRQLYSENSRYKHFNAFDLEIRAQMIQNFSPDLALAIHFDGDKNSLNNGRNGTKAYVAGSFLATEFSTREARVDFVRHALNPSALSDSVRLSRAILDQINDKLGIPYDDDSAREASKYVAPGVFARNLYLTRKIHGVAFSYLECFFYNAPAEYRALTRAEFPLSIDGQPYPYSKRHIQLVEAIRDGVIEFFSSAAPTLIP